MRSWTQGYHDCGIRPPTFHCEGGLCAARDTTPMSALGAWQNRISYAPATFGQATLGRALGIDELDPCFDTRLRTKWSKRREATPRILCDGHENVCLVLLDNEALATQPQDGRVDLTGPTAQAAQRLYP